MIFYMIYDLNIWKKKEITFEFFKRNFLVLHLGSVRMLSFSLAVHVWHAEILDLNNKAHTVPLPPYFWDAKKEKSILRVSKTENQTDVLSEKALVLSYTRKSSCFLMY